MILATRRGDLQVRSESLGQLIDERNGRTAGVVVTGRSVRGIPAWNASIRVASQAVAQLTFGVWRGQGVERRRITATWQARLFSRPNANERDSWFSVWQQTEESLTARNNGYWLKAKDETGRVAAVYVIPPDPEHIEVEWRDGRKQYRIRLDYGLPWSQWVDDSVITHFRGDGDPGCLVPPSPIQLHKDALGVAIAKQKFASSFFERGIGRSLAVSFPREMKSDEARQWREIYQAEHGGIDNMHNVRVFGGGPTVTAIGLTLEEAQYVELMQFDVEQIARMTNVQASLIGGGVQSQVTKPLSPEHEQDRWLRFGLGPRLARIESTIASDPDFFGPGSRDRPAFDASGVLRGDLATEADISLKKVQSGQWLVDEARAKDGLPPLPGGLGKIPQIVPVGGAPNPPSSAPPADEDEED